MVKLIVCCLVATTGFSFSAIGTTPTKRVFIEAPRSVSLGADRDRAIQALRQPLKERLLRVRSLGKKGLETFKELAFDPREALQTRWRAITSMGQVWPRQSLSILEKALSSNKWFMRNAAMIALTYGSRKKTLEWADKLLDDKALVVRTAAVQAIDQVYGRELSEKMWSRLNAKENFRYKKSIWIRKYIVRALSKFGRPEDTPRFVSLLRDRDARLYPYAIKGLERATGQVLGYHKATTDWKREKWLAWWRARKKKSLN